MARFYFFTDHDKLLNQANEANYGPISDSGGNNRFRVCSMHSSVNSDDLNAYAVCKGRVFIQDAGTIGSVALVNLILKPEIQPGNNNPGIKYFVYRGIRKDTLIANNVIADPYKTSNPDPAISKNNLTKFVHDTVAAQPGYTAIQDVLGINFTTANNYLDTDGIEKVFYTSRSDYDLLDVQGGWTIGKFYGASFGLEIIVDRVGYRPTMAITRSTVANNHIISVPTSALGNHTAFFTRQNQREEILNYLDPCAFYGNFFQVGSGDQLYRIDPTKRPVGINFETNPNTDFLLTEGNSVYQEIVGKESSANPIFKNRNTVYVDIRDELNNSYDYQNYYGSFDAANTAFTRENISLGIGAGATTFNGIGYYRKDSWPLLILNHTAISPTEIAAGTLANQQLLLRLPHPYTGTSQSTDPDFLYSAVYYAEALTVDASSNVVRPANDQKFIYLKNSTAQQGYTDAVTLAIPNYFDNVNTANNRICAHYAHLNYIRLPKQFGAKDADDRFVTTNWKSDNRTQSANAVSTILNGHEYFDHVFLPINMQNESPWPTPLPPNTVETNVYYDKCFVDYTRITGRSFMANRGIANHSQGVTLFMFATDRSGFNAGDITDSAPPIMSARSGPVTVPFEQWLVTTLGRSFSHFSGSPIPVRLNFGADGTRDYYFIDNTGVTGTGFDAPTGADFDYINISTADWANILTTYNGAGFIAGTPVYLALKYDSQGTIQDSHPQGSGDIYRYTRYEIVLRGYESVSNRVQLKEVQIAPSRLFHYTIRTTFDIARVAEIPKGRSVFTVNSSGNKRTIEMKVYLMRGMGLSQNEYLRISNFIQDNIRQVWTSTRVGTGALANTHSQVKRNHGLEEGETDYFGTGSHLSLSVMPDAAAGTKGVQFLQATSKQLTRLEDNEILIICDRVPGITRSYTAARRAMMMIYLDNSIDGMGLKYHERNTPGHEFGHVLGLLDRYTQVSIAKFDDVGTPIPDEDIFKMNRFYARQFPFYLPDEYDTLYTHKYRWWFNLMTNSVEVPASVANPNWWPVRYPAGEPRPSMLSDPDFQTEYGKASFVPQNEELNPLAGNTSYPIQEFNRITVFITKRQIDVVLNAGIENGTIDNEANNDLPWGANPSNMGICFDLPYLLQYEDYIFFYDGPRPDDRVDQFDDTNTSKNHFFKGSFVGYKRPDLALNPNDEKRGLVTDYGYARFTLAGMETNGRMNLRCRVWSDSVLTGPSEYSELIPLLRTHLSPYDNLIIRDTDPNGDNSRQTISGRSIIERPFTDPVGALRRNQIERGEDGGVMQPEQSDLPYLYNRPRGSGTYVADPAPFVTSDIITADLDNRYDLMESIVRFFSDNTTPITRKTRLMQGSRGKFVFYLEDPNVQPNGAQHLKVDEFKGTSGNRDHSVDEPLGFDVWNFKIPAITNTNNASIIQPRFNKFYFNYDTLIPAVPPGQTLPPRMQYRDESEHGMSWDAYPNRRIMFYILQMGAISILTTEADLFPENVWRVSVRIDRR